ncbi:hypothetical protein QBC41DRAFT_386072 [Cercophora samala]|uniref:Uncharacterized protein n=1 Tax=Cercophora samala TaxID=330535 RepID=A0AA39ZI26_9PEZI|nr:hypothetical protein QBC41DRAFT_386072 [Cercophora samala]
MKSQKGKSTPPARNARAPASPPTSIPAPVHQTPTASSSSPDEPKKEDKLEDVLKQWSSTPERNSLPFLKDLHTVGRLYDNMMRSRSSHSSRKEQFDAYDEARGHLDGILQKTATVEDKRFSTGKANKAQNDTRTAADITTSTPAGPKQAGGGIAKLLAHRPDLKHLKPGKSGGSTSHMQSLPSTPVLRRIGGVAEPTAPGSKVLDVTPWRRDSPPTPTPSRVVRMMGRMSLNDNSNGNNNSNNNNNSSSSDDGRGSPGMTFSSPGSSSDVVMSSPLARPIGILRGKNMMKRDDDGEGGESTPLLPFLDLPLPPMRVVATPAAADDDDDEGRERGGLHESLRPIYSQSYVNGVIEALKHAHGTIATLSQEKREMEGRVGVLEGKMKMWHALVHGQGCRCGEGRWWGEVEEVLIELRGKDVGGRDEEGGGKAKSEEENGKRDSEGESEMGRFGMDGVGDDSEDGVEGRKEEEDEETWDVVFGSPAGSPEKM